MCLELGAKNPWHPHPTPPRLAYVPGRALGPGEAGKGVWGRVVRKGTRALELPGTCQADSGQVQVLAAGWGMQETCARPLLQPDRRKSHAGDPRKSAFIVLILSVPESAGGGSAVRAEVQEPKRPGICKFQLCHQ